MTGHAAIEIAEAHGLALAKYADPTEGYLEDLTPDEAREIAQEDPGLIHIPWIRIDSCGRPVDQHGVVLDIDIERWVHFHLPVDKDGDPVGWHIACPPGLEPPDYPIW